MNPISRIISLTFVLGGTILFYEGFSALILNYFDTFGSLEQITIGLVFLSVAFFLFGMEAPMISQMKK